MYSQLTGFREYPCPEDDKTLEEAILDQLDELHTDTMQAYAEYCGERMEVPVNLILALILSIHANNSWESLRGKIGRSNEWLDEALNVIVYDIDKHQKPFLKHEAERRRKEAEEIKHGRAA